MAVPQMEALKTKVEDLEHGLLDFREKMLEQVASLRSLVPNPRQNERVIIMVDRSNLDQTWRRIETGPARPDYMKIRDFLTDGRTMKQMRVYFSDVDADMVREEDRQDWQRRQDFYAFLRHNGCLLRGVRKKVYDGKPTEKGLDGALIRDMETITRDGRCDTVVLVAGDADYCEVVQDAQDRYCIRVEVAFFLNQTARDLQVRASKFINLECFKDKITRTPDRAATPTH